MGNTVRFHCGTKKKCVAQLFAPRITDELFVMWKSHFGSKPAAVSA
jgi:hypothetical protein